MKLKEDQARIKDLLKDTITLLCKNGLHYRAGFSVEALIGITLDEEDVFLVNIKETIKNEDAKEPHLEVSVHRAGEEGETDEEERSPHKKTPRSGRKRPPDVSPAVSDLPSPAKHSRTEPDETSNASEMSKDSTFNIKAEPHDDDDLVFIKEEGSDYSASCSQMGNQHVSPLVVGNVRTQQTAMITHQGFSNPNFPQSFDSSAGDSLPGMTQWDPNQANLSSGALDSSLAGSDGVSQQQKRVCKVCNKVFKHSATLRDHMRGSHGVGQPFRCENCDLTFGSRRALKRHRDREDFYSSLLGEECQKQN